MPCSFTTWGANIMRARTVMVSSAGTLLRLVWRPRARKASTAGATQAGDRAHRLGPGRDFRVTWWKYAGSAANLWEIVTAFVLIAGLLPPCALRVLSPPRPVIASAGPADTLWLATDRLQPRAHRPAQTPDRAKAPWLSGACAQCCFVTSSVSPRCRSRGIRRLCES